jgi:hypothetical protein
MASTAGPPSGRGIDEVYILARIAERVRQVEASWDGAVRISAAGLGRINEFAALIVADFAQHGLPPGVDESALVRQLDAIVPDILEQIRSEAEATGAMISSPNGTSELPAQLIGQRLSALTAQRCLCWPQ